MMDGGDVGMQQIDHLVPISVATDSIHLSSFILIEFLYFMNDHIC